MAQGTSPKLALSLGLALILFVAVVTVAVAAAPPKTGAPAPAFSLPLVANGNGNVSLHDLRGHAIYLNFFASWCGPCKEEVQFIGKLSKEYAKRNIVVVGVDELEPADQARQFVAQRHLPYRIALDDSGDVGGSYGLIGLPLHVFIGRDGNVAGYKIGEISESQLRQQLQALSEHR